MREADVHARGKDDVIRLSSKDRWIRHIPVAQPNLPAEPLVDLGHGRSIKREPVLPGIAQVRIEVENFRRGRAFSEFVHSRFAYRYPR